ncbi:MAG: acetyl-CoA carboxylase biotin carboxyl carrier protein, partial [Rhodospirillaceae bacterium]|nr:acetyl-CoA carboxylase biotin carboxyl carrier protein [Rhodospirillaceae bacterium]
PAAAAPDAAQPLTEAEAPTASAGPATIAPLTAGATGTEVRAPMVGTFYRKPSPADPVFVETGQAVKKGDPLCLIEVMKLYTTIEAPIGGTVKAIGANDAELVAHDQVLFVIEPA